MEQVKEVECSHCEHRTPVRVSTLVRMYGYLPGSSPYDDEEVFACPDCTHLGLGFFAQESQMSDIVDRAKSSGGIAEFGISLKCAGKGCLPPVLVLAPMKHGTNKNQARAQVQDWTDTGVKCEAGHLLSNPLSIAGEIDQF
jgi:hypothetical protein